MDLPPPIGQLRTVLRTHSRPNNRQRLALFRPESRLVSEPVAPFLDALLVLDAPLQRTFVSAADLQQWNLKPQEAFTKGLKQLAPATGLGRSALHPEIWSLDTQDGYASSRLLQPGWLQAFSESCQGQPVAVVPSARVLYVTDSANTEALTVLLDAAWRIYNEEGDPLSPVPLLWNDGGLRPLVLPPDHPAHTTLQRALLYLAGNEYAQQKSLLDEWQQHLDTSTFVAPYLLRRHHGSLSAFTVLPERETLLPAATWIKLGTEDPRENVEWVHWTTLETNGWLAAPEPNTWPLRWRVLFPRS
jgi:hypothetical protein